LHELNAAVNKDEKKAKTDKKKEEPTKILAEKKDSDSKKVEEKVTEKKTEKVEDKTPKKSEKTAVKTSLV